MAPFGCDHIGILTGDADRLEEFYITKLGFQKEKDVVLSGPITETLFGVDAEVRFIRLFRGDFKLEIFQPTSEIKSGSGAGFHHFGLVVGDKDEFLVMMAERDVPVIRIDRDGNPVYFIKDPDGNLIEIR